MDKIVTKELLDKLAHLARLEFDEKDEQKLLSELNQTLNWVKKLEEVDTTGLEPLTHVSEEVNVLRADKVENELATEKALSVAPKAKNGYFIVPKVK
jgi:aspartyl-tRNA(Asn)/glutamyl-tRNA(Gln) amidotransferase subunit C